MARRIYALFGSAADGPLQLAVPAGQGWQTVDASDYIQGAGDELVVFVPGTEVTFHRTVLPARTEREARRAAPFAIEDDVASPAETLHVALSEPAGDGLRSLLVCDPGQMTAWLQRLASERLSPACVTPDYMALSAGPIAVDLGDRYVFDLSGRRMAVDAGAPSDMVSALAGLAHAPLRVIGPALARRLGMPGEPLADSPVATLASLASGQKAFLDLRQGAFSTKQGVGLAALSDWQRPAALAAIAAVGWLAIQVLETRALEAGAADLRAEAQALYAARFPAEGRVSNPATRLGERLRTSGAGQLDFLEASSLLYAALDQIEGASLQSIRFERETGQLRASVEYARPGDDLRLAEALGQQGLSARLGDTRSTARGISGDLTLGAAS